MASLVRTGQMKTMAIAANLQVYDSQVHGLLWVLSGSFVVINSVTLKVDSCFLIYVDGRSNHAVPLIGAFWI